MDLSAYRSAAYRQLWRRQRWILRPCLLILAASCCLICLCVVLVEGAFPPALAAVLLFPPVFTGLVALLLFIRAARSTRERRIQRVSGYLVDGTDMFEKADADTLRILAMDIQMQTGTSDDAEAAAMLLPASSLRGSHCIGLVAREYYETNIRAWRQNPAHDLLLDSSLTETLFFFPYDELFAGAVRALCTEPAAQGHAYRVSACPVTAVFVDVRNTDRTLLEIVDEHGQPLADYTGGHTESE